MKLVCNPPFKTKEEEVGVSLFYGISSNFSTELGAILWALRWVEGQGPGRNVQIPLQH